MCCRLPLRSPQSNAPLFGIGVLFKTLVLAALAASPVSGWCQTIDTIPQAGADQNSYNKSAHAEPTGSSSTETSLGISQPASRSQLQEEQTQEEKPVPAQRRRERDNHERDFQGILRIHDPSTIVQDGDTFWIVHTGMGIGSIFSKDLKHWNRGPNLLAEIPAWVSEIVPGHSGYFWAPDVIQVKDRYLVYFSVSSFGKNESAIGLLSSPTLDPESPDYQWTDHGIVVRTTSESDHNAIDPAVIHTDSGELWMSFGSFWSGLKLVQLDPETGLMLDPKSKPISLAYQEQIEAPFILFHGGYYYLFFNWGWCCRGTRSTYNIRVGRSREIQGPYLDRNGVDLRHRGGTLVLDTIENRIGPGHPGVLRHGEKDVLSYHYYDEKYRGRSRLGIAALTWDEEGWPVVEEETADLLDHTHEKPETTEPRQERRR